MFKVWCVPVGGERIDKADAGRISFEWLRLLPLLSTFDSDSHFSHRQRYKEWVAPKLLHGRISATRWPRLEGPKDEEHLVIY